MTKRDQNVGKHGEQLAESVLSGLGFEMLEKIATPVILIPYHDGRRIIPGVYQVKHEKRVSGDRRAILPDGTSVLIEVKTRWDDNLIYSDLEDHQHEALKRHAGFNGLSLLVYVHNSGVFVMRYERGGIAGFIPRKSITPARAAALHKEAMIYLQDRLGYINR
jgi:hypothetical protein